MNERQGFGCSVVNSRGVALFKGKILQQEVRDKHCVNSDHVSLETDSEFEFCLEPEISDHGICTDWRAKIQKG